MFEDIPADRTIPLPAAVFSVTVKAPVELLMTCQWQEIFVNTTALLAVTAPVSLRIAGPYWGCVRVVVAAPEMSTDTVPLTVVCTKAVVANLVVLSPAAWVGPVGEPVKIGELSRAKPFGTNVPASSASRCAFR